MVHGFGWNRTCDELAPVCDAQLVSLPVARLAGFRMPRPWPPCARLRDAALPPVPSQVLSAGGCMLPCGPMVHFEPVAEASSMMPLESTAKLIMQLRA